MIAERERGMRVRSSARKFMRLRSRHHLFLFLEGYSVNSNKQRGGRNNSIFFFSKLSYLRPAKLGNQKLKKKISQKRGKTTKFTLS